MLHFRPSVTLRLVVAGVGLSLATATVRAQTFVLDPMSASLPGIPATSGDFLRAGGLIPTGAPPLVAFSNATLALLPGDVIDAISFGNDGPVGTTLTFSVTRAAAGAAGPFTPHVLSEVTAVPPGIQPEAAGDLFTTLDPACPVFPPFHTQIVDGNGMALVPFTCYGGLGAGLAEVLPLPGPPLNDDLSAFDWSLPGTWNIAGGVAFSLAAGSPSLTPGTNPALPAGAEPGDILAAIPGVPPFPTTLLMFTPVASLGLISGGPGCAPPACDDVDALSLSFAGGSTHLFSITPGSPSIGACAYAPGDVLGAAVAPPLPACLPPFLTGAAIGLAAGDDVDALESFVNGCPIPPAGDVPPDGDGVAGAVCDNCPAVFNPSQDDADFDGAGDLCDPCTDSDGDGFGNPGFASVCALDLCPLTPGPNVDTDGDGLADECDNCPGIVNPGQENADFDVDGDACDPCPHVFAALPAPMTGLKKLLAIYGGTGPGSGDDRPKVIKAEFSTGVAFDPDSTDDVHVTLRDAGTGATMFAASLTAASGLWSQPNPAKLLWKFDDVATTVGVRKALLKERPPASTAYQFKLIGKNADIGGPLVGPGMTAVLEINPAGLCFSQTNVVCTSTPAKDLCK